MAKKLTGKAKSLQISARRALSKIGKAPAGFEWVKPALRAKTSKLTAARKKNLRPSEKGKKPLFGKAPLLLTPKKTKSKRK